VKAMDPSGRRLWFLCCGALMVAATFVVVWQTGRPNRLFRAGLAAAERDDLRALVASSKALSAMPGQKARAHLLTGIALLRSGNYRDALAEFEHTPPEGELREPALLYVGECLYHSGALMQARNCLQRLALERPDLPAVHRWLAAIHYDLGAMNEALAELELLINLEPDDFRPHRLLGQMFSDAEKFPEAIEQYRLSLERNPPAELRRQLILDLAAAQIRQRLYDDALKELDTLQPDAASSVLRAECLLNLGRNDEARAALDDAAVENAVDPRVLLLEARLALDANEAEAALSPLRTILEDAPHHYAARYQLAQALRRLGRREEAADELKKMEESRALSLHLTELNLQAVEHPDDADIRNELARTCRSLGKTDLAAMWAKAAAALRQQSNAP